MENTISVAYALNKRGYTVEFLSMLNSTAIEYVMFYKEDLPVISVIKASKLFSDEISAVVINTEKYISKYDSHSDYILWKNKNQLYVLKSFIPISADKTNDFDVSQISLSETTHHLLNYQNVNDNSCQGFVLGKLGTSNSFNVCL